MFSSLKQQPTNQQLRVLTFPNPRAAKILTRPSRRAHQFAANDRLRWAMKLPLATLQFDLHRSAHQRRFTVLWLHSESISFTMHQEHLGVA